MEQTDVKAIIVCIYWWSKSYYALYLLTDAVYLLWKLIEFCSNKVFLILCGSFYLLTLPYVVPDKTVVTMVM